MRHEPAGDFDYESRGAGYSLVRRPDPRFAARIRRSLGEAHTLVNVGAGVGSYEPSDMHVTPVEPSAFMRSQRSSRLAPAIDAIAEDLPFEDNAFDAALACVTVHQWRDLDQGLSEVRRVTKGPVVIMTFDPGALASFWLADYAPEMMERECARMPRIAVLTDRLGGDVVVESVPIPAGCTDGFAEAFFGRPEAFLDRRVRGAQSAWSFVSADVEERSVASLLTELDTGEWDVRHGALRHAAEYVGSLRLVIGRP